MTARRCAAGSLLPFLSHHKKAELATPFLRERQPLLQTRPASAHAAEVQTSSPYAHELLQTTPLMTITTVASCSGGHTTVCCKPPAVR